MSFHSKKSSISTFKDDDDDSEHSSTHSFNHEASFRSKISERSKISSTGHNQSSLSASLKQPDSYGFTGGRQYQENKDYESESNLSPDLIVKRELKWLYMFDNWEKFMKRDFATVRRRCRKGIPRSVRGRAWYYLCGGHFLNKKNPNLFNELLQKEGDRHCLAEIQQDLHRQFDNVVFSEDGHGREGLFNVLKAYSILKPDEGYSQAHGPIAACLLMNMPQEHAFFCLLALCDKYFKGYHSPGMESLLLDGDILFGLVKSLHPPVYKHLKKQAIDPMLYSAEWFLCAYTRTLIWPTALRIWDMFLCEGVKILFKVGLVLLKYGLGEPNVMKNCQTMSETVPFLKNLPSFVLQENFMMYHITRLNLTDERIRKEHTKQLLKRKKMKEKNERKSRT